jgi:hypothetical protein
MKYNVNILSRLRCPGSAQVIDDLRGIDAQIPPYTDNSPHIANSATCSIRCMTFDFV